MSETTAREYPTKEAREHDETMRMQALAIAMQRVLADPVFPMQDALKEGAAGMYREATGREW